MSQTITSTPLLCNVDLTVPTFQSSIVKDYFLVGYGQKFTVEYGAKFTIL